MVMTGLTLKFASISLGIGILQPFIVFSKISIYSSDATKEIISCWCCRAIDNVYHGPEGEVVNSFIFYECLFTDIHVWFPFDEFQMGVLHHLKVAPTQLHFNSWAFMQAFHILCKYVSFSPSPRVFLYFYSSQPGK